MAGKVVESGWPLPQGQGSFQQLSTTGGRGNSPPHTPPPLKVHKTLAVRTIGGHGLKQWTVGDEGRGEQARLGPNADIAT